jgi:hypothetical protein
LKDESHVEKEILILRRKAQVWMFIDLIGFLIDFIGDLIARKLIFKSI